MDMDSGVVPYIEEGFASSEFVEAWQSAVCDCEQIRCYFSWVFVEDLKLHSAIMQLDI